jgi:hypothetical protein
VKGITDPVLSGKKLPVPAWEPFRVVIVSYYFFARDFPRLYKNIKFLLILIATGHPHSLSWAGAASGRLQNIST